MKKIEKKTFEKKSIYQVLPGYSGYGSTRWIWSFFTIANFLFYLNWFSYQIDGIQIDPPNQSKFDKYGIECLEEPPSIWIVSTYLKWYAIFEYLLCFSTYMKHSTDRTKHFWTVIRIHI